MRVLRSVLGVVGEVAITAGVILLLFVVWELGVVGVTANRAQAATVETLERQFRQRPPSSSPTVASAPTTSAATPDPTPDPTGSSTTSVPMVPASGAFAILRIPRLGTGWAKPVYEGVGSDVLAEGLGHYPGTQLPGAIGNVGLAGHRAGHGSPLLDIDTIRPGDPIVVETAAGYSVYRAVRSEIVPPTDVNVLAPVPNEPGATPTQAWLTVTSCEPKYGSTNRFIVVARLDRTVSRDQGPPPEIGAT